MKLHRPAVVLGGIRTPFARAGTNFAKETNLTLMTAALKGLTQKFQLTNENRAIGDVALGAVINQSRDWNLAREAVMACGLPMNTPAMGIMRACGTGLEAAIAIGNKIALGQIDSGIAGGVDSMSDVPVFYQPKFAQRILKLAKAKGMLDQIKAFSGFSLKELKPGYPAVTESKTGLSMGQSCELMAQEWKISREEQDDLAYHSHQNSVKAYERGFHKDLMITHAGLDKDNNVRADTSREKLAKLKPAFERSAKGTLTAGNSSPLTDGASCALLSSEEWAKKQGLEIHARLVDAEVSAVDFTKEGLLMAPAYAVARLLARNDLKLQDFDFYEIHEAFAAQVLCTLKAWESETFCRERLNLRGALGSIDRKKINVVGGSVALGHPFGATGARILATAAKILKENGKGRVLISICTGGGMGVTAILER
ncbi:MAG: acetyl-CoA C-acetyltransferase [Bdellovibrionales bacterium]